MSEPLLLLLGTDADMTRRVLAATRSVRARVVTTGTVPEAISRVKDCRPLLVVIQLPCEGDRPSEVWRALREAGSSGMRAVFLAGTEAQHRRHGTLHREPGVVAVLGPAGAEERLSRLAEDHLGSAPAARSPVPAGEAWNLDGGRIASVLRGEILEVPAGPGFARTPPAVVLARHCVERKTGILVFRRAGDQVALYLRRGELLYARGSEPGGVLRRFLVESEGIPVEACERAEEIFASRSGRVPIPAILTEIGALPEIDAGRLGARACRWLLSRVLGWREGGWCFLERELPVSPADRAAEIGDLLLKGCRACADVDELRSILPGPHETLVPQPGIDLFLGRLGLDPAEREVLALLDGSRTSRQIRGAGWLAQVPVEGLLAGLLAARLLRPGPPRRPSHREDERPALAVSWTRHPASGAVSAQPVQSILSALHIERATGILRFEKGRAGVTAILEEGEILNLLASGSGDPMESVLVRSGLVAAEQMEAVAAVAASCGYGTRRALLDHGLVSLDSLRTASVHHARELVRWLAGWNSGAWSFLPAPKIPEETPDMGFDTDQLILEAVRALGARRSVRALPPDAILRSAPEAGPIVARSALSPLEEAIVTWLSDETTVSDLLEVGVGENSEVLGAVRSLIAAGLVEWRPGPGPSAAVGGDGAATDGVRTPVLPQWPDGADDPLDEIRREAERLALTFHQPVPGNPGPAGEPPAPGPRPSSDPAPFPGPAGPGCGDTAPARGH